MESGRHGMGLGESGWRGDWSEFDELPGRDVDELDFVAAVSLLSTELLCVRDLAGLVCGTDPRCPVHSVRAGFDRLDEVVVVGCQLFEELVGVVRAGPPHSSGV